MGKLVKTDDSKQTQNYQLASIIRKIVAEEGYDETQLYERLRDRYDRDGDMYEHLVQFLDELYDSPNGLYEWQAAEHYYTDDGSCEECHTSDGESDSDSLIERISALNYGSLL